MEAIIDIVLTILAWRVLVAFLAGVLLGYGWFASRQLDKDMKQAQLDQEKTLPGITAHVEAYKIQEQARYSAYVELGQVPVTPDETNYLRMSEEDKEMMERIRQRILDRVFPRAPEPEYGKSPLEFAQQQHDDKIARRLLASLDSSETNGGEA